MTITETEFGCMFLEGEDAYDFIDWLSNKHYKDPRELYDSELEDRINEWRSLIENQDELINELVEKYKLLNRNSQQKFLSKIT